MKRTTKDHTAQVGKKKVTPAVQHGLPPSGAGKFEGATLAYTRWRPIYILEWPKLNLDIPERINGGWHSAARIPRCGRAHARLFRGVNEDAKPFTGMIVSGAARAPQTREGLTVPGAANSENRPVFGMAASPYGGSQ